MSRRKFRVRTREVAVVQVTYEVWATDRADAKARFLKSPGKLASAELQDRELKKILEIKDVTDEE